jgi:excisionase family DNA binding protein
LEEQQAESSSRARSRSVAARRRSKLENIDSPPSDDELLSTAELTSLLNVNPKTVGLWATHGGLPSFRTVGGHRRFRWADVTAWVERGDA